MCIYTLFEKIIVSFIFCSTKKGCAFKTYVMFYSVGTSLLASFSVQLTGKFLLKMNDSPKLLLKYLVKIRQLTSPNVVSIHLPSYQRIVAFIP